MSEPALARAAMRKASARILPLLGLGYLIAYMDRYNISFAALQMNVDLGFTATVYGLGAGLFFLSYALFEVPSNMFLTKFGARRWIARIMISWGVIAAGMMFVRTPQQFYVMRFLLGMAEAGFLPGVIFYLSRWFPSAYRGRAISRFYVAAPIAGMLMGVVSGALLSLDGIYGLRGWQWLFLLQGLPALLIAAAVLLFLPESPDSASWLAEDERSWLKGELAREADAIGEPAVRSVFSALAHPLVLWLGIFGFLTVGANITFTLSVPQILRDNTHLDPVRIGWIVSVANTLGAIAMLICGAWSDRLGERWSIMLTSTAMLVVVLLTLSGVLGHAALLVISTYIVCKIVFSFVVKLVGDALAGCAASPNPRGRRRSHEHDVTGGWLCHALRLGCRTQTRRAAFVSD